MGPHPQWYLPLIDGFSMIENGQAKKRGVGGGVGLRNKKKRGGEVLRSTRPAGVRFVTKLGVVTLGVCSRDRSAVNERRG